LDGRRLSHRGPWGSFAVDILPETLVERTGSEKTTWFATVAANGKRNRIFLGFYARPAVEALMSSLRGLVGAAPPSTISPPSNLHRSRIGFRVLLVAASGALLFYAVHGQVLLLQALLGFVVASALAGLVEELWRGRLPRAQIGPKGLEFTGRDRRSMHVEWARVRAARLEYRRGFVRSMIIDQTDGDSVKLGVGGLGRDQAEELLAQLQARVP
jgi:hypothetical protein